MHKAHLIPSTARGSKEKKMLSKLGEISKMTAESMGVKIIGTAYQECKTQ